MSIIMMIIEEPAGGLQLRIRACGLHPLEAKTECLPDASDMQTRTASTYEASHARVCYSNNLQAADCVVVIFLVHRIRRCKCSNARSDVSRVNDKRAQGVRDVSYFAHHLSLREAMRTRTHSRLPANRLTHLASLHMRVCVYIYI